MLYRLSYFRKACYCKCGQRWIRTTEGVSQQIYSLPHLATLVFAHISKTSVRCFQQKYPRNGCKGRHIFYRTKCFAVFFGRKAENSCGYLSPSPFAGGFCGWFTLPSLCWPPHPTPCYIKWCHVVRQWAKHPTDFGSILFNSLLPFSFGAAPLRPS